MPQSLEIQPRGPFSLRAAAGFGFGPNEGRPPPFDGAMRLAFPVDGGVGSAGAVLRQPDEALDGAVTVELYTTGDADPQSAAAQAARVVSLDHDGEAFVRVGEHDPPVSRLQLAHAGQRPVLFHSPYEATAWSIIAARRPAGQAARIRAGIAERLGHQFELAGQTLHAFPQPDCLVELPDDAAGLNVEKITRLRALAAAALSGALDVDRLLDLGPERAYEAVQKLNGIGPFYATLVVLRGTGFADALLPVAESRVLAHAGRLYGLTRPLTLSEFEARAEAWRPFRTWTSVLIRLAGDRGTF